MSFKPTYQDKKKEQERYFSSALSSFEFGYILRVFPFFLLCFLPVLIGAQNLVPNCSFEDTLQCSSGFDLEGVSKYWMNPNGGTPDYFHKCSGHVPSHPVGYQWGKRGKKAYAGIITYNGNNGREYVSIELKKN